MNDETTPEAEGADEARGPVDESEFVIEGSDEGDSVVAPEGRVVIEKNDRSLAELHRWHKNGRLVLDPDWQREYVWDRRRASKLVESVLVDIPVPVVYLAKSSSGAYEVIDGLQRLSSVFKFFDGELALSSLDMREGLNGMRFAELDQSDKNKLEDATFRTFELAPETPKDLMFVIFERLNTGGVRLNEMEIRNCLFRGPLNSLIRDLAQAEEFRKCLNTSGVEKRMSDRALVLRFLAFYERHYSKAKYGINAFLNEFFDTYRNASRQKLDEYHRVFHQAIRACYTVFGDKGFRLKREGRGSGEWATRYNAAIFQVVSVSFAQHDKGALTRAADAIYEEYLDLISTDVKWKDVVRRATGETTRLQYAFETWFERSKQVVDQYPPNDAQRVFSRALKEELFTQDGTCALCSQRIVLIDDAAVDHIEQYWRGGRTIPENARLVHRHCNLARPRE